MSTELRVTIYTPPEQVCQKCKATDRMLTSHHVRHEVTQLDEQRREHYLGLGVMVAPIVEVAGDEQVPQVAELIGARTTNIDGQQVAFFNDLRPDVIEKMAHLPSLREEEVVVAA